jgi:hypothetical protein
MFAMLSPSISMTSSKHTKSNTGRDGVPQPGTTEIPLSPRKSLSKVATKPSPRHRYDGRICEAEFRIALTAKGLKGVEKQLRARNEVDLTRL